LLVHEANRGKLEVNPFDSHRLGCTIKELGADEDELKYCVAFELKKKPEARAQQFAFNESLVSKSKGMLAPIKGNETHVGAGGNHFTQF
jgi:hypothetical protein